jgi:hypothetical protein
MKKFAATILAILYLSTSMGATVHLHYCMGKLFSWSFTDKDSKNCGRCGMPKSSTKVHCLSVKDGCCKDKHAHLQLGKDQKITENVYTLFSVPFNALPGTTAILPDLYVAFSISAFPTTHAPPDADNIPLFIRNRHFRI